MIRVYTLECGRVGIDAAVAEQGISANPLKYMRLLHNTKKRIWLPVKAFLIEHPKGNILVDTGWDSAVREHPIWALTPRLCLASKPDLPQGQAADERIEKLGISADMLDFVIMTHLDIDHASGLRLVKNAKKIVASEDEISALYADNVRYTGRPIKGVKLDSIPFADDDSAPFGKSWDVFGDGTVKVIFTPGHSRGSVAVRVAGEHGFALIVGDTGYHRDSWEKLELSCPMYDREKLLKALKWVAEMKERPDCIDILASHDPEERRNIIEIE